MKIKRHHTYEDGSRIYFGRTISGAEVIITEALDGQRVCTVEDTPYDNAASIDDAIFVYHMRRWSWWTIPILLAILCLVWGVI